MSFAPNRYALAIHTASSDFGCAISNFADDQREQTWAVGRDISNYLHLYLSEFIQPQTWTDLDFIAVAKGPGGFTGTRLGIVTARTLAQQLDVPLFAISTLAAVAWKALVTELSVAEANPADVAVQMPAQRGEVHGAIYSIRAQDSFQVQDGIQAQGRTLTALMPDTVLPLEQWQQVLSDWQRPYQLFLAEGGLGNTAQSLLDLAYLDWQQGMRPHWSEVLPFYGQSPV